MNERADMSASGVTGNGKRGGFVINGVVDPPGLADMTTEQMREYLLLPEGTGIEIVNADEDGETSVRISWPKGIDGDAVLQHIRRIIWERMARVDG